MKKKQFDLILTEVNFDHCKMDGIDLAHQINYYWNTPVIFLVDLPNDILKERIKVASPYKTIIKSSPSDIATQVSDTLEFVFNQTEHKKQNSIIIKSIGGLSKLKKEDIVFVLAAGSRCSIFYRNDKEIIHTVSMKSFVESLNCDLFVKTHRSYTVNITHIESVMGNEINLLFKDSSWKIPLSNLYKDFLISHWAEC